MDDDGKRIVVRTRTPCEAAIGPVRDTSTGQVHGYHWWAVADMPVDNHRLVQGLSQVSQAELDGGGVDAGAGQLTQRASQLGEFAVRG